MSGRGDKTGKRMTGENQAGVRAADLLVEAEAASVRVAVVTAR